jgi:hypothetical protein
MLRLGNNPANLELNFVLVVSGPGVVRRSSLDLTFRLPGLGDRFAPVLLASASAKGWAR